MDQRCLIGHGYLAPRFRNLESDVYRNRRSQQNIHCSLLFSKAGAGNCQRVCGGREKEESVDAFPIGFGRFSRALGVVPDLNVRIGK